MKRVRVWPVCVVVACLLAVFLWFNGQLSQELKATDQASNERRVRLSRVQSEQTELKEKLELVGTEAYIENQARTVYGYMRPEESRFVITNPEVLYGTDEIPER